MFGLMKEKFHQVSTAANQPERIMLETKGMQRLFLVLNKSTIGNS